jgi:hypothetical protein
MSRTLSAAALAAMFAQETDAVFLVLLTLTHPDITTLRVVNNTQDVTSRGNVYVAFPFDAKLPTDIAEQLGTVQLTISNVDRRIIDEIRTIEGPMTATFEVVTASAPDTVEVGPLTFDAIECDYTVDSITATLAYEPILNEPFPAGTFNPQDFPAMFGSAA